MKHIISLIISLCLFLCLFSACGEITQQQQETVSFSDSAGRTVDVPAQVTKIAPSGSVAQMILLTLVPDRLVGLASKPDAAQLPYFPDSVADLPEFGQFYGSKANINMEALIAAQPQIIIDLGDYKDGIAADMDMVQNQTGIPTVFIDASLENLPTAYRLLGSLLGAEESAETLASYIEETLAYAAQKSAQIPSEDRKTIMYGTGASGLACNPKGSSQADVIELVGGKNVIEPEGKSHHYGGTEVNLEQVYALDPDVLLFSADGPYDKLQNSEWSELFAVKYGTCYEVPALPYSWMSMPPSVNRVIGIWWLGNLLYPDVFDYDMTEKAQEFYKLFWNYDLSDAEAAKLLERASMK